MADYPLLAQKTVSTLPSTLTANTLYFVRVGNGFDLYMTDSTGQIAHKINDKEQKLALLETKLKMSIDALTIVDNDVISLNGAVKGQYVSETTGGVLYSNIHYLSDYIEIISDFAYKFTSVNETSYVRMAFYDENKTFIPSSGRLLNGTYKELTITNIPSNAKFMRLSGEVRLTLDWKLEPCFPLVDILSTKTELNTNIEFLKKYVQSRGTGLITNGFGMLLDNTNFSKLVYDRTDAKAGFGSFTTDVQNFFGTCDEFIPVNPNSSYEFSFWARTIVEGTNNLNYAYVDCYDIDQYSIQPHHIPIVSVQLAQDYSPSNPVIVAIPEHKQILDGFYAKYGKSTATIHVLSYSYTSNTGFKYPDGTYSRIQYNQRTVLNTMRYDTATGTISNVTPNSTTNLRAGDWVSLASSSSTFIYHIPTLYNHKIPTTWTEYKRVINMASILRNGTAFIKIGWLCNRGTIATGTQRNKVAFSAINLRETFAISDEVLKLINANKQFNAHQEKILNDYVLMNTDSDNDTVSDYDEINRFNTSPTDSDSDNDEWTDAEEVRRGTDPNSPNPRPNALFLNDVTLNTMNKNTANDSLIVVAKLDINNKPIEPINIVIENESVDVRFERTINNLTYSGDKQTTITIPVKDWYNEQYPNNGLTGSQYFRVFGNSAISGYSVFGTGEHFTF